MGLTTAQDLEALNSWSILRDYANNQEALLTAGKVAYQMLRYFGGEPPPSAGDLEQPLKLALQATGTFKTICATKRHANPALYAVFALALARYMLDFDWRSIASP